MCTIGHQVVANINMCDDFTCSRCSNHSKFMMFVMINQCKFFQARCKYSACFYSILILIICLALLENTHVKL